MKAVSVSALNEQIKNLLETTFVQVAVEGELSRITYHNSGHIYFTLKDSGSAISGVMFRGNAAHLRFRLEEGLKVVVRGGITLYKPRGSYQINAQIIEPAGQGALALAYEQLKARLSEEGLFDSERKKALPRYPKKIALITSATGAALQDMKRVAVHRWPLTELFVYDSIVQGEQAPFSLLSALNAADKAGYDVIVLSRGGGSMEDLWGFNDEALARAVAAAATPVVSAVGHEIDWVITDFVADLRAPTPSAAMQMILPDQYEMMMSLDGLQEQYDRRIGEKIRKESQSVLHLFERYKQHSVEQRIKEQSNLLVQLQQRYDQSISYRMKQADGLLEPMGVRLGQAQMMLLNQKQSLLNALQSNMIAQDPKSKVKKGFAQVVKGGRPVSLYNVSVGDEIELMDSDYTAVAEVKSVRENSTNNK
ncbi:exodeoxyribonuclease VII large subunit [Sulfurimonas sp. HSL1-2]|uniref:exodeoxyribonuclease VII large subunit n=1 Tax=Thiomicrolovo zhangzhouensis TaxID=3131933 RepID=UPI0031F8155F